MAEVMVKISRERLEELLDDERLLNCLRRCGVDNWDGWDYAIEMLEEEGEA